MTTPRQPSPDSEAGQTSELKPCPFCGDEKSPRANLKQTHVFCTNCGAHGPILIHEGEHERAWNLRTSPPIPDGAPDASTESKTLAIEISDWARNHMGSWDGLREFAEGVIQRELTQALARIAALEGERDETHMILLRLVRSLNEIGEELMITKQAASEFVNGRKEPFAIQAKILKGAMDSMTVDGSMFHSDMPPIERPSWDRWAICSICGHIAGYHSTKDQCPDTRVGCSPWRNTYFQPKTKP